jgi:hypothetical protein
MPEGPPPFSVFCFKQISRLMVFGASLCLAAFPGARPDHNWVREHLLIFACGMHAVENMYGQLPVKQQVTALVFPLHACTHLLKPPSPDKALLSLRWPRACSSLLQR